MADKFYNDTTKLRADGANYREWCVKTRAKIQQHRLGKYLKKSTINGTYLTGLTEKDDLVALSYIQLTVHADHLNEVHPRCADDFRHLGSLEHDLRKRVGSQLGDPPTPNEQTGVE